MQTPRCYQTKVLTASGKSIAKAVADYQAHINRQGRHWGGTEEEFKDWALKSMEGFLRHLRMYAQ